MKNTPQQNASPVFLLAILLFATLITQLISLAFGRIDANQDFASIILPSILFLCAITVPLAWFGIKLSRQVGFGLPNIEALVQRQPGAMLRIRNDILLPVVLGVALGILLLIVRSFSLPYLPPEVPAFGHRGVVGGLAVSIGAAVAEEVWFRLGLMTILVWLGMKLTGSSEASPLSIWLIILITAIGFGAAHLPQLISYGAGSPFAIAGTVIGNTAVGILYGWSYWRRGLLAAIAAHFSTDLIIHVISAL